MESLKCKDCGSNSCQLVLFVLVAVTGLGILITGLVMNSKYGPQAQEQPLIIRINSLSVSDLNISSTSISSANWDAELLFGNRHQAFEVSIDNFESYVYYNRHDALSCAVVEPIHLGPKRQKLVVIKFNATGCGGGEQPYVEDSVVKDIKRDGDNGTLHVGLLLDINLAYRRGPWSWVYELKPNCSRLDVLFLNDTGYGILAGDEPILCSVPVLK